MSAPAFHVRAAVEADLDRIIIIQAVSPGASQWNRTDYQRFQTRVAEADQEIVGLIAYRTVAPGEHELLNLAVAPGWRRQGVGRSLIEAARAETGPGTWFLEVRESNHVSRNFYQRLGFTEAGIRKQYYNQPPESGIVMRFHS